MSSMVRSLPASQATAAYTGQMMAQPGTLCRVLTLQVMVCPTPISLYQIFSWGCIHTFPTVSAGILAGN